MILKVFLKRKISEDISVE
jgi:hypothetical protein